VIVEISYLPIFGAILRCGNEDISKYQLATPTVRDTRVHSKKLTKPLCNSACLFVLLEPIWHRNTCRMHCLTVL